MLILIQRLQYSSVAIFIMERLQGADVLTYLTSRHDYTEQMVATIITQVNKYSIPVKVQE